MINSITDNKAIVPLHKPASKEKFFFFISGIMSSIPLTLFINTFADYLLVALPRFYASLLSAVVFAPFIEEFSKAFPLFYRHGETERTFITLGFLVGLGFGIFEFFTYIILLGAPIPGRIPAVFLHPMSTSITGYGIATKRTAWFYLLAVALHFSFNFSALFFQFLPNIGIVAVLVTAFILLWRFYNKTSERFVDSQPRV